MLSYFEKKCALDLADDFPWPKKKKKLYSPIFVSENPPLNINQIKQK